MLENTAFYPSREYTPSHTRYLIRRINCKMRIALGLQVCQASVMDMAADFRKLNERVCKTFDNWQDFFHLHLRLRDASEGDRRPADISLTAILSLYREVLDGVSLASLAVLPPRRDARPLPRRASSNDRPHSYPRT